MAGRGRPAARVSRSGVGRGRMALVDTINPGLLPRIRNLESKQPRVSDTICHRGAAERR